MLTLEWTGKNKVMNHHQEVPFRVLERQYSFGEQGQHTENNDSENMIIHGDNLEALKALLPQYEGKVKYIYIVILTPHSNEYPKFRECSKIKLYNSYYVSCIIRDEEL